VLDLPTVLLADELLDKAFGRAAKATIAKGPDRATRQKNLAATRVQIAGHTLESTLRAYVKGFPSLDRLPPFYRELVDILVDSGKLKKHLGAVDWASGTCADLTRSAVRRIGKEAARHSLRLRKEAFGRLASVVGQIAGDLEGLVAARTALRRLPVVDPDIPTIVVAGYPNVGKSAFVRAASSGRPKIADYPFTTKRVSIGHFERGARRYQVLDTPGLLDRPMEARNRIERQAVNALAHLADVVLFILDPTGTAGYPLEDQLRLLDSVRATFPDTPVVVVATKADLAGEETPYPQMSSVTGDGVQVALDLALAAVTSRAPASGPR